MAPLKQRTTGATELSSTALAAILTGVGVVLLALFICLTLLLVKAIRTHKRLIAELEERGVEIEQVKAARKSKKQSLTKPRAVLRRTKILPFNKQTGWDALPSAETINILSSSSSIRHYAPPKPAGFVSKSSRLSWPFSARRRSSSKAIHMRKIRVPILSTVIESPKPSPLVPVLGGGHLGGEPRSPRKSQSRPSSDQSLLQHHPAFRNMFTSGNREDSCTSTPEPLRRSLTAKPTIKTSMRVRPNRSKSVTEVHSTAENAEMFLPERPKHHARSASICSQSSGKVPNAPMPLLPLEVARIKNEARRRSLLSRSPSQSSILSRESVNSSILVTQPSPTLSNPTNVRAQNLNKKRDWRSSRIVGPRPFRDTLILHGKNQRSQSSIKSSTARLSSVTAPTTHPLRNGYGNSTLTASSSLQSVKVNVAESVTLNKVSSPACSPLTVRSYTTPRRKSGSLVTVYGSPEERRRAASIFRNISGSNSALERQLSQASTQASSTRSSNGNPFQWDPTPLSSGKPSALKGSPSARKGHRRQNCVRISLAPTILGPPSPSPVMNDIQEEPSSAESAKWRSVGSGFSSTRSLPRPPSTSVFAPELKITGTSIRASSTPSSPTFSMANYDRGLGGLSVISYRPSGFPRISTTESNRYSNGSVFSIPEFPSPGHGMVIVDFNGNPPPSFALSRPSNEYSDDARRQDSPIIPSSLFKAFPNKMLPSRERLILADEYDPERPSLVFQTPMTRSASGSFSSPFSPTQEQYLSSTKRTCEETRHEMNDSPPCSPKTDRPNPFLSHVQQHSFPQHSSQHSIISEEDPVDSIDPMVCTKEDPFSYLNSGVGDYQTSIVSPKSSTLNTMIFSTTFNSANSMFAPLLEAAFPSSHTVADGGCHTPTLSRSQTQSRCDLPSISIQSSPSSVYSNPSPMSSPSPSPIPPCSPRPVHAQLPMLALNLSNMPILSPSLHGPRASPPRPLRSSIQKLRRMNSDAEKKGAEKSGKAERMYLRLGRENSIVPPGDESWLDELEDEGSTFNEEKQRQLITNVLDDWEEEATILKLGDTQRSHYSDTIVGASPETEKPRPALRPDYPPPQTVIGHRSSSIWEDGEIFWQSTPPTPHSAPNSPNKPRNTFLPLSSSPIAHSTPPPLSTYRPSRKRDFQVAKDEENSSNTQVTTGTGASPTSPTRRIAGNRYRTRSALGISTPNVRINILPPSGSVHGTPGSLYDADGFLRA
ncbi:hypothetical protein B0J11DRAFT_564807 [Dendryphion nanum]|uniref:Uncharacterized protein n=1 Tax=Dendryphion nanum TaxID=256645 RepID=A0A9P9ECP8_9PLEO|nr:hypothetical protein B0J11DRAFT_564807 [Dendryphion nanum]